MYKHWNYVDPSKKNMYMEKKEIRTWMEWQDIWQQPYFWWHRVVTRPFKHTKYLE
jgi:hypothetical protein